MAEFFTSIWKPLLAVVGLYAAGCVFALPKGNESPSMLTMLPRPLAAVLFLPIFMFGAVEFYIAGVVWQICCFLFAAFLALIGAVSHRGVMLSESVLTYGGIGFFVLFIAGSLTWMLIRRSSSGPAAYRSGRKRRRLR